MFNKEQLKFIKIQVDNCKEECLQMLDWYGYENIANAGAEDAIKMSNEIIKIINKKLKE